LFACSENWSEKKGRKGSEKRQKRQYILLFATGDNCHMSFKMKFFSHHRKQLDCPGLNITTIALTKYEFQTTYQKKAKFHDFWSQDKWF